MYYYDYHFLGMHLIWWCIWGILLFWIYASPYIIPWRTPKNKTALEILKKRFASGQINKEEYLEKKKILEEGK